MPKLLSVTEKDPRISIDLEVRVWFDENRGNIHIAGSGIHTHLNPREESKRGHPNLFWKLADLLNRAGRPAPTRRD